MENLTSIMEKLTTEELGAIAVVSALIASILMTVILIRFAWYAVQVIANWQIFKKMGEPGWKSIIPFYNEYTLYKRTWKTMYFWITLVIGIIAVMASTFSSASPNAAIVCGLISLVCLIAACVISIIECNKISKSFGHGAGFTVGLVFLGSIFRLVLAFGASQYIGNTTEQNKQ